MEKGDRVVVVVDGYRDDQYSLVGRCGVILRFSRVEEKKALVLFDAKDDTLHDGYPDSKEVDAYPNQCWWFPLDCLAPAPPPDERSVEEELDAWEKWTRIGSALCTKTDCRDCFLNKAGEGCEWVCPDIQADESAAKVRDTLKRFASGELKPNPKTPTKHMILTALKRLFPGWIGFDISEVLFRVKLEEGSETGVVYSFAPKTDLERAMNSIIENEIESEIGAS